jgi:hypothetical protein
MVIGSFVYSPIWMDIFDSLGDIDMRKYLILSSMMLFLLIGTVYLLADEQRCGECHAHYYDGYALDNNVRGDIYRILESPCSALSKIREECFNTETLIIKTQNIIFELNNKENIEVGNLQTNLDAWKIKYRELLEERVQSLQEFKDKNAEIRFNIQKVYKDAADYQIQLDKRIAFGIMFFSSMIIMIFFIQGFKNSAGPGHPSGDVKLMMNKTGHAVCIALLSLLLALPLFAQVETQKQVTYLDKLSNAIEPLNDVSQKVFDAAKIAERLKSQEQDKAFMLLQVARKLWNNSEGTLRDTVLPLYQNPDKGGWGVSDENRYEKIGKSLDNLCAPWALRELVIVEWDFGLNGNPERLEEIINKINAIKEPYSRFAQLSELSGVLASRDLENAKKIADAIPDPYFQTRAWVQIAKNCKTDEAKSFAETALNRAKSIDDPRFKTEIILGIYKDFVKLLSKPDESEWKNIEADFDLKASPEATANWYSRLVELIAGYDNAKAESIAKSIPAQYPEPYVHAMLVLYDNGEKEDLDALGKSAIKITDPQIRDGYLSKIAIDLCKENISEAKVFMKDIQNDFFIQPTLSKILLEEFKTKGEIAQEDLDKLTDPYIKSRMNLDIALFLIGKKELSKASEYLEVATGSAKSISSTRLIAEAALIWSEVDVSRSKEEIIAIKDPKLKFQSLLLLSDKFKSMDPELADVLLKEAYVTILKAPKISDGDKASAYIDIADRLGDSKKDLKIELYDKSVKALSIDKI